jgi:hypothetical protein
MPINNRELLAALERVHAEWRRYTHACVEFLDEHEKNEPKYSGALLYEGLNASFALASVEAVIKDVPSDVRAATVHEYVGPWTAASGGRDAEANPVEAEAERRIRSEDETEVEPVQ